MALYNIVFSEGDEQNITMQIPPGILYTPKDIVFEPSSTTGRMVMQLGFVVGPYWTLHTVVKNVKYTPVMLRNVMLTSILKKTLRV